MSTREHIDTVIVGAGQAGLATAYYLGRAGVPCLVLDEHDRVGDQWRRRYDSLLLNTPAQYDSLPGWAFPAPRWTFPSSTDMGDYLEAYAGRFAIDVRHGTPVTSIEQQADGTWVVCCDGAELAARNVVVAIGGERHPKVPALAAEVDPGIRQLHSSTYRNPGQLLPGPVLVVGAGQSGADLAQEAQRAGHQTWLSGRVRGQSPTPVDSRRAHVLLPVLWFLANHVLTTSTPAGRRMKPVVRMGGTPLVRTRTTDLDAAGVTRVEARTEGTEGGLPRLADGQVLDVANIIWCTGFRQDFSLIRPSVTGEDGWPVDEAGVVPGASGLYFVGLLFQRGFYSMLIGGAWRDARRIAEHIAGRPPVDLGERTSARVG
ncbi:portal protein [Intrasporangium oryzae NRRL B-24470]|uniref:Portal protein n=1 Tax=Intrasporangium oryzae NRRL B-24470 TaxID=1386089 RepID=W9G7Y8_9MICO|nr:NAD(P)-binding domain-containing protein [Intrasporangium oryzae]EWT02311.1 portal protein [Intrasporangium oryzae NRRL B-24470]